MSGKDILEDVSESEKFPTVIFITINRDLKQQTFESHGRRPEVTLRILFHTAHGITFVSGSADPRTACFRFSPERPPFKTSR